MKKRTILLFSIVPLIFGFLLARVSSTHSSQNASFSINNVQSSDTITLSSKGDVYKITKENVFQVTHNQNLIEPELVGDTFIAVSKNTNYSSLITYDASGHKIKTLFNGNASSIDTMSWITDPAIDPKGNKIAYVSDKDKKQTNVPDNALYVLNLNDGKSTNIANPDPYSGGLSHPIWNPIDPNILLFDYYQYDPDSFSPYSTIEIYNKQTGLTSPLTFEKLNAYQEAISPDGKQILLLSRNSTQNTVTLYIADMTANGLNNTHSLITGDLAYPAFSNTKNQIYYLYSEGNKGYNLATARIENNKLNHVLPIVNGFQLLGNSSFSVTKKQ